MAKAKTVFFCKECGYESSKWLDNVPAADMGYLVEEPVIRKGVSATYSHKELKDPVLLSGVKAEAETRIAQIWRARPGTWRYSSASLVLVGGDPNR